MTARVTALALHPVKSTAVRRVRKAEVEPWGLRSDRRWMLVDGTGECLTAREDRRLLGIRADTRDTDPSLGPSLRVRAPGAPDLLVEVPDGEVVGVTVHGRALGGRLAGGSAQRWWRELLGREDVRFVHVATPRPLNPHLARAGEATAFADGYPVTLASEASLRRLDEWVAQTALEGGEEPAAPLDVSRFRPNLVVDGDLEPFEEDGWSAVRVGPVTFRVVKPVDRCVMTTVDPATRARGPEPIRTLARHRKWAGATWFAIQLVPGAVGAVRVGDEVVPHR